MARKRLILAADFTCPFSFVTETGLRQVIGVGEDVRHLAYELHPAPLPLPVPEAEPDWLASLTPLANSVGLELRPPTFVPRTRKAHEAARIARDLGREVELRAAIYSAYWNSAEDIGRIDVLVELGRGVGLEVDMLRVRLDVDAAAAEVDADEALAEQAGIRQTPTLIVGEGHDAVVRVGAVSVDELRSLPLDDTAPLPPSGGSTTSPDD